MDNRRDVLSRELLDHVPEGKNDTVDELGFLVERKTRGLASPSGGLPSDPRLRARVLDKVWIIVVHGDHNSGVERQRVQRTDVLDVGTGYGRRGEGFVDRREGTTWSCWFGLPGSVPILVVHAGAVSVLDTGAP